MENETQKIIVNNKYEISITKNTKGYNYEVSVELTNKEQLKKDVKELIDYCERIINGLTSLEKTKEILKK